MSFLTVVSSASWDFTAAEFVVIWPQKGRQLVKTKEKLYTMCFEVYKLHPKWLGGTYALQLSSNRTHIKHTVHLLYSMCIPCISCADYLCCTVEWLWMWLDKSAFITSVSIAHVSAVFWQLCMWDIGLGNMKYNSSLFFFLFFFFFRSVNITMHMIRIF